MIRVPNQCPLQEGIRTVRCVSPAEPRRADSGRTAAYATLDAASLRGDAQTRRIEPMMSKRSRKRRSRKSKAANHGRKPNA